MSVGTVISVARAQHLALAAVGVFWGSFAALVPDIKSDIGAADAPFGLALMMAAAGGILAMALAPRVMGLLGRWGLPVAGSLLAVGMLAPLWPKGVVGFGCAMAVIGASVSLLDIGANMRLSVLEDRYRLHLMNFSHAMFSLAFAATAFAVSMARKAGYGPAEVLPWSAAAGLLLAILMCEGRNWRDAEPAPDGADGRTPWVPILLVAAMLMASFISENATETWSALHIERTLGGPPGEGGFGPAAFGLMMGIGRLLGQVAAHRLGEVRLVFWSAVAGISGAAVLAFAPTPTIGVIGVGLLGLGVAVVVPSANSILGRLVRPDQRGHAISRAWMIGFSAFFVGPAMMGAIAEVAGLRVAFGALALIMATILPCVLALRRRGG